MTKINLSDQYFMQQALKQAHEAFAKDEVPVGAVVLSQGQLIAKAHNLTETLNDVTAHAEMLAVTASAEALGGKYLNNCTLYVTVEPCPMCAQAISFARLGAVFFGAYDIKGGGVDHGPRIFEASSCFHKPDMFGGILERKCQRLLKAFFNNLR